MSEEVVRQTRSQKRALEREAAPQSVELSNTDNDSKKPKLDPSEPPTGEQTESKLDFLPAQDIENRTTPGSDHEEQEPEQNALPLSLVLPLASQPIKEDRDRTQKWQTDEPSSDNQTDCNDRASKARMEPSMDTRSRVQQTESKVSSGILAAGEVKATIKVEVQTEQPVDMSTTRGWETVQKLVLLWRFGWFFKLENKKKLLEATKFV